MVDDYSSQSDNESVAYCTLNSIILYWAQNNMTPFDMSENDKSIITSIANGLTSSAPQAQAILRMVFDESITPWEPSDTGEARLSNPEEISEEPLQFEIYPNPANDASVIIANPFEGESNSSANIIVRDITGTFICQKKVIITDENTITLPVNSLSSGIYIIELNVGNYPSRFQKLIIKKT